MKKLVLLFIISVSFAKAQDTSSTAYFTRSGIIGVSHIYAIALDSCQIGSAPHWSCSGYKEEGYMIDTTLFGH